MAPLGLLEVCLRGMCVAGMTGLAGLHCLRCLGAEFFAEFFAELLALPRDPSWLPLVFWLVNDIVASTDYRTTSTDYRTTISSTESTS